MMPLILPAFRAICTHIPYAPKGMFFSELFLFLRECERRDVTTIIESGVKFGGSTRVLAATFTGRVISVDQKFRAEFLAHPPAGVQLLEGDARHEIPRLLDGLSTQRVGVLIDGPKGMTALSLKDRCLTYSCVQLVGIHDLPASHGETKHSQDETFREYFGRELDALLPVEMRKKYPKGPGLGIWGRA